MIIWLLINIKLKQVEERAEYESVWLKVIVYIFYFNKGFSSVF